MFFADHLRSWSTRTRQEADDHRQTTYSVAELPSPYDRRSLNAPSVPSSVQRSDTISTDGSQVERNQITPASLPQRSDSLDSQTQEVHFTLYRDSQGSDVDEIVLQPSSTVSTFSSDIQQRDLRTDVPRTPSVEIRRMSSNADASHLVVLQKRRHYDAPRSPTVSLPVSVHSPSAESFQLDLQRNHSVIDMYMPKTPSGMSITATMAFETRRQPSDLNRGHSVLDFYLPQTPGVTETQSPTESQPSERSNESIFDSYSDPSPLADAFPLPPTNITRNDSLIDLYSRRITRLETLHEVDSERMSTIAEQEDDNRESLLCLYKRRTEVPGDPATVTIDTNVPPLPSGFEDLARSPAPVAPFVLSSAESRPVSKGFADPSPDLFDVKKGGEQTSHTDTQSADDPVTWATLVARAATGDEFVVRPFSLFQSEFVNSYNDRHVSQLPSSLRAGTTPIPPVPPLPTLPANSEGSHTPAFQMNAETLSPQSTDSPRQAVPMYGYI